MVVGVAFNGFEGIYGLLIGGGIFWISLVIAMLVFDMEIVGGGDIKLMAGVGACLGMNEVFVVACVAVSISLITLKVRKGKSVPFAPIVLISTIIMM